MKTAFNRISFLLLLMLGSIILTSFISASFDLAFSHGVLYTALLCVFIWVCFNVRHMRLPGVAVCAAVLFFVCRSRRDAFVAQLKDLFDKVSGQYLNHFYYSSEKYVFSNLTDDHTLVMLVISAFIVILMAIALSAESGRIFSCLIVSGVFFAACICVNGFPPVYVSVGMVLFWTLVFVSGGSYSADSGGGRAALILSLPALLMLCVILSRTPPDEYDLSDADVEMAQKLDALGQSITKIFKGGRFTSDVSLPETSLPVDGLFDDLSLDLGWNMGDGALDLSKGYRDFDPTRLMLRVRADKSGYMYLRCFSYGQYLGTSWSAGNKYLSSTPPQFLPLALQSAGGAETLHADIELIAVGSSVLPVPYYSTEASENDVYVPSGGSTEYTAEYISYSGDVSSLRVPDEYAAAEEDYRAYVYEYYTALPDSTREAMLRLAADAGISAGDDAVNRVASYIMNSAEYDLNVSGFDTDDYAVYFLTEAKRGYCTHFATAAAVMYRALGIPARVVDGFAFTTVAGSYVDVRRSDEHAWVEVYIDGLGWLPVEVTGSSAPSEAPVNTPEPQPETAESTEATPTPSVVESPELRQDTMPVGIISSDVSQNTVPASGGAAKAVRVIVIVLAAAGVIVLWQFALLRERKRRFTQRDGSRAVLYIYRCAKALSRFNEPIPRDIVTLAEKARFSQHGIGREERMAAYALFIGMRDKLCGSGNLLRKFVIKYVLGFR